MESYLEGITELLRTKQNSRIHSEGDQDVTDPGLTAHDPVKQDTTWNANKDLLRRLNRGHLLQFDELSEEDSESVPVQKASLIDLLKFEVC